jgi:hypothetical protein
MLLIDLLPPSIPNTAVTHLLRYPAKQFTTTHMQKYHQQAPVIRIISRGKFIAAPSEIDRIRTVRVHASINFSTNRYSLLMCMQFDLQ